MLNIYKIPGRVCRYAFPRSQVKQSSEQRTRAKGIWVASSGVLFCRKAPPIRKKNENPVLRLPADLRIRAIGSLVGTTVKGRLEMQYMDT